MVIYDSREEAYKKAREIQKKHSGAEINEGVVTLSRALDGMVVEKSYKTFEVFYENYDEDWGWMDCSCIVIYREN